MILVYDTATSATFDTAGTTGTGSINTIGGATGDPCISLSGLTAWANSPKLVTAVDISSITSNDFIRFDYKFVSGTPTECYTVLNNSSTIIYFAPITNGTWQTKTLPLTPTQITALGGSLTRFYVQLNNTGAMLIDNIKFMTAADIAAVDSTVPVITLVGANPLRVLQNATFTDPGATWADNSNTGTVSSITGTVNTAVVGAYTRTYSYSDGVNTGSTTRTVIVDPPYGTPVTTNIYTSEATPTFSGGDGVATVAVVSAGGNDGTNCLGYTFTASYQQPPRMSFAVPLGAYQAKEGDILYFDIKRVSGTLTEVFVNMNNNAFLKFVPNVYTGNWHTNVQVALTESQALEIATNGVINFRLDNNNAAGVVYIDNVRLVMANAAPIDENGTPDPDGSALTHFWANDGCDKVTKDERRLALGGNVINSVWDGTTVNQYGGRNEVVSVNLILENNSSLYTANGCTVELSTLTKSGGDTIVNATTATGDGVFNYVGRPVEIFVVEYLRIKGLSLLSYDGESYDERHVPEKLRRPHNSATGAATPGTTWADRPNHDKYYPEIAIPHETYASTGFRVKPLNNQSIWIDIYIPKTTPTGIYTGTITVKENLGANTAFTKPFQLTVESYTLPDVPSSKTMVTLGFEDIGKRYLGVEYPSGAQFTQLQAIRANHFKAAHRHKISLISSEVTEGGATYTGTNPSTYMQGMMTGSYFVSGNGYDGPGVNTGTGIYSISHYGIPGATVQAKSDWITSNVQSWESWFATNSPDTERFVYLVDEPKLSSTTEFTWANTQTWAALVKSQISAISDATAPTVSITSPANAAVVSGALSVTATASDNIAVAGVQFKLDGSNFGSEVTVAPYSTSVNTTLLTNGSHTLTAVARDTSNNTATSSSITIVVSNGDAVAPTVSVTSPSAGATISGASVTLSASASDNVGIVGVQFKVDGANVGIEDITAPYSTTLNTTSLTNGSHTITAVARDAAGNTTTSTGVAVTVSNADTVAPTVAISGLTDGQSVSGSITVNATASDNIAVAGVQFKLDGANLGTEDAAAPYAATFDTTQVANGLHSLLAVARDETGNSTSSAVITVNVNNVGGGKFVSEPILNRSGQVLPNLRLTYVALYNVSTHELVVSKTNIYTDSAGKFTIIDPVIIPGTQYKADWTDENGGYRLPSKAAI